MSRQKREKHNRHMRAKQRSAGRRRVKRGGGVQTGPLAVPSRSLQVMEAETREARAAFIRDQLLSAGPRLWVPPRGDRRE